MPPRRRRHDSRAPPICKARTCARVALPAWSRVGLPARRMPAADASWCVANRQRGFSRETACVRFVDGTPQVGRHVPGRRAEQSKRPEQLASPGRRTGRGLSSHLPARETELDFVMVKRQVGVEHGITTQTGSGRQIARRGAWTQAPPGGRQEKLAIPCSAGRSTGHGNAGKCADDCPAPGSRSGGGVPGRRFFCGKGAVPCRMQV
jgi:hypothetical protein